MVRIKGADLNGSDLTLPANWTDDGRGLITETPIERTPLAAGIHRIHVSLNGQQYNDEMALDTSVGLAKLRGMHMLRKSKILPLTKTIYML